MRKFKVFRIYPKCINCWFYGPFAVKLKWKERMQKEIKSFAAWKYSIEYNGNSRISTIQYTLDYLNLVGCKIDCNESNCIECVWLSRKENGRFMWNWVGFYASVSVDIDRMYQGYIYSRMFSIKQSCVQNHLRSITAAWSILVANTPITIKNACEFQQ